MSKRVADVLVAALQAAGVKRCYGIVGDTVNRIAHTIDRIEIEVDALLHATGRSDQSFRLPARKTASATNRK